jgi:hypothetical protein
MQYVGMVEARSQDIILGTGQSTHKLFDLFLNTIDDTEIILHTYLIQEIKNYFPLPVNRNCRLHLHGPLR